MPISKLILLIAALITTTQTMAADPIPIKTQRGALITVVANFPQGAGPFPAVVLGPGTGTMKQKINDVVEHELLKNNIAVFRFEWAFYVKDKNGKPSDTDRSPEIEDFTTVLELAKADKRVDRNAIIVGGKSRGTVIAWQVLRNDPTLKGILQLTPVCSKEGFTANELYPDITKENRPSLWIAGDADSACQPKTLYSFLSVAAGLARAAIVIGDHGLATHPTSQLTAELSAGFVLETIK
jgi:dienelactone hydrolase